MSQALKQAIAEIRDEIVALRHDIHRYPEPGFEETRTQARLLDELACIGLDAEACARTGIVADVGAGTGRRVALRADMDCLRITEENHHLAYRSEREGLAHMCGHDGHAAMLLGAAKLLANVKDELGGVVRLLFQPAEEGPGGAEVMLEEGALEAVDEVFGLHNWPQAPLGTLRVINGACMAHVATFHLRVIGKGGHASQPHAAVDPVLAAAHLITALQSVVSRNLHYGNSNVVSVTMVRAGDVENVIPDEVMLTGTIRTLDDSDYAIIERRISVLASQTASAFGAAAECSFERAYPVLVNHAEQTEAVRRVAGSVFGEDKVSDHELPMLGSEDFAYFTQARPGCYFFLGGAEPGRSNAMCHASDFDFNDKLIEHGIEMWIRLVEDRLGKRLYA